MVTTTIKLSSNTKKRLDALKTHPKESFEEVIKIILDILNECRINPEIARSHLIKIDRAREAIRHIKLYHKEL